MDGMLPEPANLIPRLPLLVEALNIYWNLTLPISSIIVIPGYIKVYYFV